MRYVLMAVAFILAFQAAPALAGTDITFPSTYMTGGHDYTVDVMISTDQDIITYDLLLSYDTEVADLVSVTEGNFQQDSIFVPYFDDSFLDEEGGLINIAAMTTAEPRKGNWTLAILVFHANESGSLDLAIEGLELLGYDMELDPSGGSSGTQAPATQSSGTTGGGYCSPEWNCTAWSVCSGGTQSRICTDVSGCESDMVDETPCGGDAYHGDYPGAEGYTTYASGACSEGTRVCGDEGVVECRDGRLVKVMDCEHGCERGICLEPPSTTSLSLDPAVTLDAVFICILLLFAGIIAFYGLKR